MNNNRDKFEAWANSKGYSTRKLFDGSTYCNDGINISLDAWQAATEQSQKEIEALQAREKVLVEALRYVNKELIMYGYQYESKDSINVVLNEALANVRGDVK